MSPCLAGGTHTLLEVANTGWITRSECPPQLFPGAHRINSYSLMGPTEPQSPASPSSFKALLFSPSSKELCTFTQMRRLFYIGPSCSFCQYPLPSSLKGCLMRCQNQPLYAVLASGQPLPSGLCPGAPARWTRASPSLLFWWQQAALWLQPCPCPQHLNRSKDEALRCARLN